MSEENGHSLTTTYDCKSPNCTGTARSRVGRYSYCDDCQKRRGTMDADGKQVVRSAPRVPESAATLVQKLEGMKKLARQADAAELKAVRLTRAALDAKAKAAACRDQLAAAMREIAGSQ